jgi:hypothetical protein
MTTNDRGIRSIAALLIGMVLMGSALLEAASTLSGIVTDTQGRVVVDASVSVLTGDRATVATATTNSEG